MAVDPVPYVVASTVERRQSREGTITKRVWNRRSSVSGMRLVGREDGDCGCDRVVEASSREGGMVRSPVFFHQQCPVCGRVVRVRVSLLGRQVFCQHCQGSFVAADPSMGDGEPATAVPVVDDLIERANDLLARSHAADRPPAAAAGIMPASTAFR